MQAEFVFSFLAVTLARATAAPLNPAYKAEEHAFYLDDSQSKLLLLPSVGLPAAQEAAQRLAVPVAHVSRALAGEQLSSNNLKQTPFLGGNWVCFLRMKYQAYHWRTCHAWPSSYYHMQHPQEGLPKFTSHQGRASRNSHFKAAGEWLIHQGPVMWHSSSTPVVPQAGRR